MAVRFARWRDALANVVPARLTRTRWYRLIALKYREEIASDHGAFLGGGRYNPPEQFGALYLGESPEACRAEVARRRAPKAPMVLGVLEVTLTRVCDLTDPEIRNRLGLQNDELIQDDWSLTQEVATAVRDAGFEAILAPSAAGPHVNLIIFKDRLLPESRVDHLAEQDTEIPPIA